MKTLLIAILLITGCTTVSHAQKVTYKELLGKWQSDDTSHSAPTITFEFIDSAHVIQSFSSPYAKMHSADTLTYTTDTLYGATLLHLQGAANIHMQGIPTQHSIVNQFFLIKIADANKLRIQGSFHNNDMPKKWDDDENFHNTGIFIRIKG